ncbi:hypothetical protein [Streptomyces sp. NPDC008139]|uniref:hypothetical protein n=1 Tax=Streptomyces sp. NPDC008139 TaxID=3364814 RepID=UPI0036E9EE83
MDAVECGCGESARHLIGLLESAIDGNPGVLRALDGHVFIQSILMPPAPAVCTVVMAMFADGLPPAQVEGATWAVLGFAAGEEDGDSIESGYYWRCFEIIRDGLLLLYKEYLREHSYETGGYLDDILEIVEWDASRLAHYRRRA